MRGRIGRGGRGENCGLISLALYFRQLRHRRANSGDLYRGIEKLFLKTFLVMSVLLVVPARRKL